MKKEFMEPVLEIIEITDDIIIMSDINFIDFDELQ